MAASSTSTQSDLGIAPRAPVMLAALGLSKLQLAALRRQGFVFLDRTRDRWKLRFRFDGRQTVRCLGTDPVRAEKLAAELREWQQPRRLTVAVRRLAKQASSIVRDRQQRLAGLVASRGFYFHGHEIRQRRSIRVEENG
jgi:hypothetical protein